MYEKFKDNALNWFFLFSLVFLTGWMLYGLQEKPTAIVEENSQLPNYTLKDFVTMRMDKQGQLKSQLAAKNLTHFKEKDTKLEAPTIIFYREGQPIWIVHAEQGEMSPDGNQISLLGETVLQRESDKPREQMTIKTRDVYMQRDKQFAETEAFTTILSNNTEIHSTGVRVFMPTKQVELSSQVSGRYQETIQEKRN